MNNNKIKNVLANKFLFALFLVITALGCTSPAKSDLTVYPPSDESNLNANVNNFPATTVETKTELPTVAPDALVADLYKQHDAEKSPFFQTKSRTLIDKYFARNLADLIWTDAKTSDGEVGALGADPLYNAQDTEIKKFAVGKADIRDKAASVPVTFENFGKKEKFIFALVQENGSWKITDINYGDDLTLIKIFKDNAAAYSGDDNENAALTGEFEGKYQIGETTCTVKPIKMAFEVKWAKGTGKEIFFFQDRANDKYIFASDPKTGKANVFSFDDENYNTGIFYRADGKEFPIKRAK